MGMIASVPALIQDTPLPGALLESSGWGEIAKSSIGLNHLRAKS